MQKANRGLWYTAKNHSALFVSEDEDRIKDAQP